MPTSTSERVAIVTGGSGGIGRVVAQRLAHDGMSVVVHYAGSAGRAEETVSAITADGGGATSFKADVGEESEVAALFEHARRQHGGVDVVINAAGLMLLAPLAEFDLGQFDLMCRTNIRGTFLVSREAVRAARAGGAIVNFATSVLRLAFPTYSGYVATKGAVAAMTLILARELRGRDVTVNTVAPGPTATPLFLDGKDQATIDHLSSLSPLERLGTPEDTAELVAFLAGPGRWVNGQVLFVNGGVV